MTIPNFVSEKDRPYTDGKDAKLWHLFIGSSDERISLYKNSLLKILQAHDVKCVLDAACGTGIDSIMLVEEGYKVNSIDASDPMIEYARRTRWDRRKDPGFRDWQLGTGDWLDTQNCEPTITHPKEGYGAIICIGNSFCCLPDFEGGQKTHRRAIKNLYDLLKPGGVLIVDHSNYESIIANPRAASKSTNSRTPDLYYDTCDRMFNLTTGVLFENGICTEVAVQYDLDLTGTGMENDGEQTERDGRKVPAYHSKKLSLYPHTVDGFTVLLQSVFGKEAQYEILPDFKETSGKSADPAYWVHVITKA